jgi:hypothetical protein
MALIQAPSEALAFFVLGSILVYTAHIDTRPNAGGGSNFMLCFVVCIPWEIVEVLLYHDRSCFIIQSVGQARH